MSLIHRRISAAERNYSLRDNSVSSIFDGARIIALVRGDL